MNALDILQPWLDEKGYNYEAKMDSETDGKVGEIEVKLVDPKMRFGHWPRNIKLLEGSWIMIRGNMPDPVEIDLAEPAALDQLEEVLNRQVGAFNLLQSFQFTSDTFSPRSSTNRMPASEAEDEGLTPSGGTSEG